MFPEDITGDIITGLSHKRNLGNFWHNPHIGSIPFLQRLQKGFEVVCNCCGSTATYIAFGNAVFGALLLFGIAIPDGTAEAVVQQQIAQKDWGQLFNLVLINVLTPLIRWIKDSETSRLRHKITRLTAMGLPTIKSHSFVHEIIYG